MKTSSLTYLAAVGCLLLVPSAFSQTVADATINGRGPNHRVWEWTERERTALEGDVYRTNSYEELKSGMHYLEADEWKETVEAFEITPEGYAVARRGPTKVIISPVLNDAEGTVDLEAADGKRLRMTLLGLSLFDRASGRSLQLAATGTSVGQQVADNVILFTNCFAESGFEASVRYVYRAGEFHQDVLLAEKLDVGLLEKAGFSLDHAVLEIWTEVLAGPDPTVRERVVKRETNPELRAQMAEPDVVDQHLDFGELKLPVAGKAYLEAEGEPMDKPVNVYKRWLKLDNGRRFLLETIPLATLQPLFSMLPDSRTPFDAPAKERYYAGRQPPKPALAQRKGETVLLASLNGSRQGPQLVLDYSTISGSIPGHTFRSDTTYYISAPVWLYGTTTFEGGAVIKYAVNTSLDLSSATLKWLPTAYRPVIFTAKDDHSVGEAIGSGALNGYYANPALYFSGSHVSLTNFHIRYAQQAISAQYGSPYFYHGQIVNCANGVTMYNGSAYLRNVLLANVTNAFNNLSYSYVYAENVTVSGTANSSLASGSPWIVNLKNSILANVVSLGAGGSVSGNNNGFYNSPAFGTLQVPAPGNPFQTPGVGAGNYYLVNGSNFRDAGTTAIDATLLADLKKKTTYPPTEVTANITSATVWSPQAQRDTEDGDALDLGYHYDPIDYVVNAKAVSAQLTLNPGVVVGTYGSAASYGLGLTGSGSLVSEGTPKNFNRIVRYNTVQEQSTGAWSSSTAGAGVKKLSSSATVKTRFTGWSLLGGTGDHFYDDTGGLVPSAFSHSQFGGGRFYVYPGSIAVTNSLWERVYVYLRDMEGNPEMYLFNNLFFGGKIEYRMTEEPILSAYDNFFDQTTIVRGSGSAYFTHDYNGYISGQNRLGPSPAPKDVTVTSMSYATGHLGNFYQALTDLANKGSRSAAEASLFHYTTTTTQQKEGFSTVDIGLHYVALDANGLPPDANTDGTADYLADANGNGIVDLPAEAQTPWFNTQGKWSSSFLFGEPIVDPENPPPATAITAIHAALLPNGKVLYWLNDIHVRLYNYNFQHLTTGFQWIAPPGPHIFCSGHTLMADGTVLVAGGDVGTPAGLKSMSAYSPMDNFWTRLPAMNEGRWYPTCTTLANGEVLITSGCYASGHPSLPYVEAAPALDANPLPQVWNPATGQFRNLSSATRKLPLYPFTFLAPDGRVFYAGSTLQTHNYFYPLGPESGETIRTTKFLSTANLGAWDTAIYNQNRRHVHYPIAVMYEPGKILVAGGLDPGDPQVFPADAVNHAEVIDLNQQSPSWTTIPQMNYARQNHNATLLADGTVLVTGGNSTSEDYVNWGGLDRTVKTAELWDPAQQTWTIMAVCPTYRGYHSTALLLPDGRVLSAGGFPFSGEPKIDWAEIFTPPYLLKGPEASRPVIVSAPSTVSYGDVFGIQTAPADTVLKVTMLRLGSVTHSFNMNQRYLNPSFTSVGNGLWDVTAPDDANLCPPGHYLLFVINNVGVPSMAKMIQVLPSAAPDVVMVCPANRGIVPPGSLKVSASVKNPDDFQSVKFLQLVGTTWTQIGATVAKAQAIEGKHYSMTWNQTVSGTYSLKARAIKTDSTDVDSPEITVTVKSFPHGHVDPPEPPVNAEAFGNEHYAFPVKLTATWDSSITLTELYATRPGEAFTSTIRVSKEAGNNIVNFPYTWPNARSGDNTVWTMALDNSGLDLHGSGHQIRLYGGALDTTFTPDAPNNTVRAVAVQPDGKVLIGGDFTTVGGDSRNRIARLNVNGTLDTDFNPGSGANGTVNSIAVQSDGKVVIGGTFTSVSDSTRHRIARFNSGGSLDTFNPGVSGGTTPTVHSIVVQPADGKIILGGAFGTVAGQTRNQIARLNADGSPDTGFNPNVTGGAAPVVYSVSLQVDADGNLDTVLLGGDFTTVATQTRNRIARLTAGGGLDNTFDPGTPGPNGAVRSVALDKDGKVVIGGDFTFVGIPPRNRIARLNANGSLDSGFQGLIEGVQLTGANGSVRSVAVELNGKVIMGGDFTTVNDTARNRIGRLHVNGTLDDTFRPGPATEVSQYGPRNPINPGNPAYVTSLAIEANGLIIAGGEFEAYKVPWGSQPPLVDRRRIVRIGGL